MNGDDDNGVLIAPLTTDVAGVAVVVAVVIGAVVVIVVIVVVVGAVAAIDPGVRWNMRYKSVSVQHFQQYYTVKRIIQMHIHDMRECAFRIHSYQGVLSTDSPCLVQVFYSSTTFELHLSLPKSGTEPTSHDIITMYQMTINAVA